MAEALAGYSPEMQDRLADKHTGVPAMSKYLPSVADIALRAKEIELASRQFEPAHTHYKRLNGPEAEPDVDQGNVERAIQSWRDCKAAIQALERQERREKSTRRVQEIPCLTESLKRLLAKQGYFHGPVMQEYRKRADGE